jgi:putative heme-binding domain-containing protein
MNRAYAWNAGIKLVAAALLVGGISSQAMAQRAPFPIPDPDPEIERKSFVIADGFEVNLFAADPLIAKPLQINFDPAGRLWIASSEVYPQIRPGAIANDKVLILEDRDHDGRADSTSVFAQGLLIPTGIEPGDGGVYVANSTELLHLKDTDRDGKADATRVVLSGFGTEDTHHILHTLRWGYDGMLYFNQSIYIHSHIETPRGVRRLGGGGIWQFRPETMELEVFIRGLVNPWGHHFDRWGQSFATDGAGGEGINYCLPGAYYTTAPDAVRIVKGLNPGSPKYCGLEVVSGRHMPEAWRGSLLTNDFRGNRVCRFVLADDGAGYSAREQPELIKSNHVAFRPIDIKMGPDGAIYIADWYNPIIQHGEVDFRDPRRDHTRGRIWRVTAKGRPLVARPRLVGATIDVLLEELKAPEDWTRQQAKRVLKERGAKDVIPRLAVWVKGLDPNDADSEHQRLEALWTYQSLDVAEPALLAALLHAKDARVRAAATRVGPFWKTRLDDPQALLAERAGDMEARVRLEAVRSLAQLASLKSAEIALSAIDRPMDAFLEYALWLTARQLAPLWLPEVQAGRFDFGGKPQRMIFALRAVDSPATVKPLLALVKEGKVPKDQDEDVQTAIARLGAADDLALVLDLVITGDTMPAARRVALLNTLVRASRDRKIMPVGDLGRLGKLVGAGDDALREAAIRAIGTWRVASLQSQLVAAVGAADTPRGIRAAAIESLVKNGGAEGRRAVDALTERGAAPEIQARVLAALLEADNPATTPRFVAWLVRLTPEYYSATAIPMARVLELRGAPGVLARALDGIVPQLSADLAKLCIRQVRASGRAEPGLIAALEKAGRLTEGSKRLSDQEMNHLLTDVSRTGDAARGEAIFRRADLNCQKCHAIAGAGGLVGPGLESVGASAQPDYLVDSLLEPGKAVKENYHALVVATSDGKVYTGIKLRQTESELVVRDAEDREVAIPTHSIEEQKVVGSLMPAGLTESLTRPELIDLVRFLSQLGKIGPFSVGTDRVLRRWQVPEPTPELASMVARHGARGLGTRQQSLKWRPAYTTVAGVLPLLEWASSQDPGAAVPVGLARSQIEVTSPGQVKLTFNSTDALSFWIDGRQVEPESDAPRSLIQDLARGPHTLIVVVNLKHRHDGFRCVLEDVPGSPARAQVVLGK